MDMCLVCKLLNGNYFVCYEVDGVVCEYLGNNGEVVWEYVVFLFGEDLRLGYGL